MPRDMAEATDKAYAERALGEAWQAHARFQGVGLRVPGDRGARGAAGRVQGRVSHIWPTPALLSGWVSGKMLGL